MEWWIAVALAILAISCCVFGTIGVLESTKGPKLEDMKRLRRGFDRYLGTWGFFLLSASGLIVLLDWFVTPWLGIGVGILLATAGILWLVNSSRYVRDTEATVDQRDIENLNKLKDVDIAHAIVTLSASAGVLGITALLWIMQHPS